MNWSMKPTESQPNRCSSLWISSRARSPLVADAYGTVTRSLPDRPFCSRSIARLPDSHDDRDSHRTVAGLLYQALGGSEVHELAVRDVAGVPAAAVGVQHG